MGWKTDQDPINYLTRRIAYYKKKVSTTKKLQGSELMLRKYGKEDLSKIISRAVEHYEMRINEFTDAVKKLQS